VKKKKKNGNEMCDGDERENEKEPEREKREKKKNNKKVSSKLTRFAMKYNPSSFSLSSHNFNLFPRKI
jgi:hypothetical protein